MAFWGVVLVFGDRARSVGAMSHSCRQRASAFGVFFVLYSCIFMCCFCIRRGLGVLYPWAETVYEASAGGMLKLLKAT